MADSLQGGRRPAMQDSARRFVAANVRAMLPFKPDALFRSPRICPTWRGMFLRRATLAGVAAAVGFAAAAILAAAWILAAARMATAATGIAAGLVPVAHAAEQPHLPVPLPGLQPAQTGRVRALAGPQHVVEKLVIAGLPIAAGAVAIIMMLAGTAKIDARRALRHEHVVQKPRATRAIAGIGNAARQTGRRQRRKGKSCPHVKVSHP